MCQVAEVLARPLDLTVVTLCAIGVDPQAFPWIEPPPADATAAAVEGLVHLGALERGTRGRSKPQLTDLGRLIAQLQVEPSLARLVYLAARDGCGEQGARLAGLLSVGGSFFRRGAPGEEEDASRASFAALARCGSDGVTMLRAWEAYTAEMERSGTVDTVTPATPEPPVPPAAVERDDVGEDSGAVDGVIGGTLLVDGVDDSDLSEVASVSTALRTPVGAVQEDDAQCVELMPMREDLGTDAASGDDREERRASRQAGSRAGTTWCRAHFVSSKALGMAATTARDLQRAASELPVWAARPQTGTMDDSRVRRLIAAAYCLNVAVLVGPGHGAGEYVVLRSVRAEAASPNPGTALAALLRADRSAAPPQWVVFSSILHTGRAWLQGVTPVDEVWLAEDAPAFAAIVRERLEGIRRRERVILNNIRPSMLRRLAGTRGEGLAELEAELGASVAIDADVGEVAVWCAPERSGTVRAAVAARLDALRAEAAFAVHEVPQGMAVRAVLGAGGRVERMLFDGTFITVNISNLPPGICVAQVRTLVAHFGGLSAASVSQPRLGEPSSAGATARLTFRDPAAAQAACDALHGSVLPALGRGRPGGDGGSRTLVAHGGGVLPLTGAAAMAAYVAVTWPLGPSKGTATLKFSTAAGANAALAALKRGAGAPRPRRPEGTPAPWTVSAYGNFTVTRPGAVLPPPKPGLYPLNANGAFVEGAPPAAAAAGGPGQLPQRPGNRPPPYILGLKNLPPAVDEEAILASLRVLLQGALALGAAELPFHVEVSRGDPGGAPARDEAGLLEMAERVRGLVPFADRLDEMQGFFDPHVCSRAGVRLLYHPCADRDEADVVQDALLEWGRARAADGGPAQSLHGQPFRLEPVFSATLYLERAAASVLRDRLAALFADAARFGVRVHTVPEGRFGSTRVRLAASSPRRAPLDAFAAQLSAALCASLFVPARGGDARLLFTRAAAEGIKAARAAGHAVVLDAASCSSRIFGDQAQRAAAAAALDAIITALSRDRELRALWVPRATRRDAVRAIGKLAREGTLHSAILTGSRVTLDGQREAVASAVVALGPLVVAAAPPPPPPSGGAEVEECSICTCDLDANRHEMGGCAHAFCRDCILPRFAAAELEGAIELPIACWAPGCAELMSVDDIALLASPASFRVVVGAAVSAFMRERGAGVVLRCPNAGCIELLDAASPAAGNADAERLAGGARTVRCPAEGITYCLACSEFSGRAVPVHRGSSCAEARDDGKELRPLVNALNAALTDACPRCKAVFLDWEGCCAVSCGQCGCSFCGWCLKDCGTDAHSHAAHCSEGKGLFGSPVQIAAARAVRGRRRAIAYLATMADADMRIAAVAACAVSFGEVGIDAENVLLEAQRLGGGGPDAATGSDRGKRRERGGGRGLGR